MPAKANQTDLPLYGAAESRAADAAARAGLALSGFELMQRAAEAAIDMILERYPGLRAVSVWCGKGNNGGDAFLVAAGLHRLGVRVQLVTLHDADVLEGDARRAAEAAGAAGLLAERFAPDATSIAGELVIDGLLGTGVRGEPRPEYAAAIETLRASALPIASLDLPSGVDSDTGAAALAPNADVTISFITHKLGLHTGAGAELKGTHRHADLGVPRALCGDGSATLRHWRRDLLTPVSSAAYKHQRGSVLVVGGDLGMPGAVILAGSAALRVGAGLVTVASHSEHMSAIVGSRPEIMFCPAETGHETFAQRLEGCDVVVLGPGLGRGDFGAALFSTIETSGKPVLLDADGLFWLAEAGTWSGGPLSITPHAGEAARLLGTDGHGIERDRPGAARALRDRYGARVVLKGPGSVLLSGGSLAICGHGNPGMASAGMGDVLSGVAGGLLADAYRAGGEAADDHFEAAVLLHSAAADVAAGRLGVRALLAADVIDALPECL